jgi:hypothetical protein
MRLSRSAKEPAALLAGKAKGLAKLYYCQMTISEVLDTVRPLRETKGTVAKL